MAGRPLKVELLKDLILTTKDGDWGKKEPQPGHVPYHVIRGGDFPTVRSGNVVGIPVCYLRESTVERRTLQPDDILIETAGGTRDRPTGRTLFVTHRLLAAIGGPTTCASFCRFLRIDEKKANARYVFWHLQDMYERGMMWEHQVQHTGVARFQYTRFAQTVSIPLPPLAEQRAIAHVLGTLDDKIDLNRRMNETLEGIARALFKSWFVDFDPVRAKAAGRNTGLPQHIADLFPDRFEPSELGEIPVGWDVKTLSGLSEKPQYGYTASAMKEPVGPRFLRITDINKVPWIDWASVPYCEISDDDLGKYRLYRGDVIIARMADPGHGALVEDDVDAVFASYLIRFRPRDAAYGRYLQYWLRSDRYWALVEGRYSGSTRASLNAKVLAGFGLIVPPEAIAKAFKENVDCLRERLTRNVYGSRVLAALRDTLLPKLISGELRVKDAERFTKEVV